MITYTVEALTTRKIPQKYYMGFSLREAFLKSVINRTCGLNFCSNCPKLNDCKIGFFLYPLVIENGKKLHLPRPYILRPHKILGSKISFKIIFLKEFLSINQLISIALSMGEYGLRLNRMKSYFSCIKIYAEEKLIYDLGKVSTHIEKIGSNILEKVSIRELPENINYIKINFITPFQVHGSIKDVVVFHKIFMNIVRRYTLLSKYFSIGNNIDRHVIEKIRKGILDKIIVKEINFKLKFFRWFSLSLNRYVKTPAYIGDIVFKINTRIDNYLMKNILYILKIGEIIGIGKNVSAGLGKYNFKLLNKID